MKEMKAKPTAVDGGLQHFGHLIQSVLCGLFFTLWVCVKQEPFMYLLISQETQNKKNTLKLEEIQFIQ